MSRPRDYILNICLPLLLSITACSESDPMIPDFEPTTHTVSLNLNGIPDTIDPIVNKFLGNSIQDDGDGRPRTLSVWTKNEDSLALKIDEKIVLGKDIAPNIALLSIDHAPQGWQEISRDDEESTRENGQFEVKWWRNPDSLMIADFEILGGRINNCGGEFGSWNRFPADTTQGTRELDGPGLGFDGKNCLCIAYDVESDNPAINGVFFKLSGETNGTKDLNHYQYVTLWIRGDPTQGFTKKFQIEFQRPDHTKEAERFFISAVTSQWQNYVISLDEFSRWLDYELITDWTTIEEFTITFADRDVDSNAKEGRIYVDNILLLDSLPYQAN